MIRLTIDLLEQVIRPGRQGGAYPLQHGGNLQHDGDNDKGPGKSPGNDLRALITRRSLLG